MINIYLTKNEKLYIDDFKKEMNDEEYIGISYKILKKMFFLEQLDVFFNFIEKNIKISNIKIPEKEYFIGNIDKIFKGHFEEIFLNFYLFSFLELLKENKISFFIFKKEISSIFEIEEKYGEDDFYINNNISNDINNTDINILYLYILNFTKLINKLKISDEEKEKFSFTLTDIIEIINKEKKSDR
jgi:hypothetical protein